MSAQLICRNLTAGYDRTPVLMDVSFTVQKGDYICIVGENGSGKSTLVKALLGLLPVRSGEVVLDAQLKKGRIGYLPQYTPVRRDFPASVREVVLSGVIPKRLWVPFLPKAERERADAYMKRFGIEELAGRSFPSLSGGQRQRVLLVRALLSSQLMLILDEPVNGLDPASVNEMYQLVSQCNREFGTTILMVSHDMEKSVAVANRILHIKRKVLFDGKAKDYAASECGRKYLLGGCEGEEE